MSGLAGTQTRIDLLAAIISGGHAVDDRGIQSFRNIMPLLLSQPNESGFYSFGFFTGLWFLSAADERSDHTLTTAVELPNGRTIGTVAQEVFSIGGNDIIVQCGAYTNCTPISDLTAGLAWVKFLVDGIPTKELPLRIMVEPRRDADDQ